MTPLHDDLLSLGRLYPLFVRIDEARARIQTIGNVDSQTVNHWVERLRAIAPRQLQRNGEFVLKELNDIYRLLAKGHNQAYIDAHISALEKRYE